MSEAKPDKARKPKASNAGGPGVTPATDKINAIGIDAICVMIEQDMHYTQIAASIGVSQPLLSEWIAADPDRSARAKESRQKSANACDIKAETALMAIGDEAKAGEIARQRELASHYRWRAKVRNPREYGDKLNLDADVTVKTMTDEQLDSRISALVDKIGLSVSGVGAKNMQADTE